MNFVYFKVDSLPYEKNHQTSFYLKGVELLRDGDIIATPGDIKITALPFFYFCIVPTGFRKIEFRLKNSPPARIVCSVGYLKTGEYLVDTPEGEVILPFNALNGLWTLDRMAQTTIDHRDFLARRFTLIRPVKNTTRNTSVN
ncbi:hypothetical protein Y71_08590 [Kosakonia radicincitans DSM 16656]|uniref:Immunity protein 26 n=1 Tax=Kosakonia radicincitans TaxID=283686 RepID=A0AAX2EV29_9ENTR|nr:MULTISPECIES: hypothetical protein [Kosakonia]APG18896.1 hypothetical protein A3780_15480 [Kosakonia radicincitans]ARD59970.1 hypothetical protein Y71_08590 [Kosakonia radicincitans DSM 16656]MDD7993852.1 hypothetical protein [Kosakonia radicincitans]NCF05346.1 hypothetical protein [Kosakonia sp. MH5]PTA91361.1 hypothetical protein CWM66_08980 [Kosakonia sp. H7A]